MIVDDQRERAEGRASERIDDLPDLLAPVVASHRRLHGELRSLRSATDEEIAAAVARMTPELQRHLDLAQRFLYPTLLRVSPDDDERLLAFAQRHERAAVRLLAQLATGGPAESRATLDQITRNVRVAMLELELRVLPKILSNLGDDAAERLAHAAWTELG